MNPRGIIAGGGLLFLILAGLANGNKPEEKTPTPETTTNEVSQTNLQTSPANQKNQEK